MTTKPESNSTTVNIEGSIYPCLKTVKRTGRVVLFTGPKTGISLTDSSDRGEHKLLSTAYQFKTDWAEDTDFEMYEGSVNIKNS